MDGENTSPSWREECAVFGCYNDDEAGRLAYLGLYAQQHRGQESAGIVSLMQDQHVVRRGLGLVGDVFKESDLLALHGKAAIGHTRYSTTGENTPQNVQPLTANLLNGPIALAHNGNFVNGQKLRAELQKEGAIFQGTTDTEALLHLIAKHPSDDIFTCIREGLRKVVGAYSIVILTHDKLIAVRDPMGFRPLVLGRRGQAYFVASETCAFDLIDAEFIGEIQPGEMVWMDKDGLHRESLNLPAAKLSKCVFEHVYFARPDSQVFGLSVYESRKRMGQILAQESAVDADLVIPVPDSGVPAALGFAQESKIPFDMGIIRNHYVGRTFIQPSASIRSFGVKIKLNPQAHILKGKRVIVVDDSLVRGTTSQKIINLIRHAGAREVHFRLASPPTISPCYYGVDTPQKSQLIAAQHTQDEIRQFIGADTLAYLSIEGMLKAVKGTNKDFCAACFDEKYPTNLEF